MPESSGAAEVDGDVLDDADASGAVVEEHPASASVTVKLAAAAVRPRALTVRPYA